MANKHGSLSIDSDNLFPIIKKWLYSDHDIFYRELISNGCDAITKLKKLDMMGEYTLPNDFKAKMQIIVNPEEKTLKFIDNGLGMTADEVEEYICQIAFSGATDFIQKYKDKSTDDQIIGHFGLGFYSAFLWLPTRSRLTHSPIRTAHLRYTGSVTAARTMSLATAQRTPSARRLRFI